MPRFSTCRHCRLLITATIIALVAVGCSEIRKLTYPGDITYIERSTVTGTMRQMADAVTRLESAIRDAKTPDAVDQDTVVRELRILEKLASPLHTDKGYTNDPVLDEHMSAFLDDVSLAREQAEMHPPNYFLAGHIAGSCAACHKFR